MSQNNDTDLGMPEHPTGNAKVSEPLGGALVDGGCSTKISTSRFEMNRTLVSNQAGVDDTATGLIHSYISSLSLDCQVVIEPFDMKLLRDTCRNNINNLKLVQPGPSKSRPPSCTVRPAPISSELSTPPQPLPKSRSNRRTCHVCDKTVKGRRGLTLHLRRHPDCRRNCAAPPPDPTLTELIDEVVKSLSTTIESLESFCGSGENTKVHKHNSKRDCGLCDRICTKNRFVSTSTHRIHEAIIPDNIPSVNCNCSNVIYLITCRKCRLQYVGETVQLLRERIAKHFSCMKHPENDNSCRILSEHFSKGKCKGASFSVNIIEKLPGDGRSHSDTNNTKGKPDPAITRLRRKKETDWMLKLRTVYPYGLNDRVGDEYMQEKDCLNIFSKFPALSRSKVRHKIRTKNSVSDPLIVDHFIYIVNHALSTDIRNAMNLIRVLLSSLKKAHCRILFDRINDYLSEKNDTYLFTQYFEAALDIIKHKIGKPPPAVSSKKSAPSNCCHIKFSNKALDFINPQRIFKSKDVRDALPHDLRNDNPTVIYHLTDTIRSKLFNYKEFVQTFDVDAFLADNSVLPCDCDNSSFTNHDHGHIISGDLNIVSDVKLRNLLSKGPKYREPLPFSCEKAKEDIILGLNSCIEAWGSKAGVSKAVFDDWKGTILASIDERISSLTPKRNNSKRSLFQNEATLLCLSDLHSKYVMVPIDKASNNIAFVCKRFYAQVLLKELGLLGDSTSTYANIDHLKPEDIIARHQTQVKDMFKMSLEEDMLTLPDIYWMPKLHKSPVKFRFIIASKKCTTKMLSKNLSSIFSLFLKKVEKYHRMAHFFSGIKSNWILQNREPVIEAVNKSRVRCSAKCVSSFDFSTLYTKIPHDKLLDVLTKIIDFAFRGGTRNKISVHRSGTASWVEDDTQASVVYTKESIREAVKYLLDECYFKLGDKLFRQKIGIPMGSDPAPAFANLFLFHYESTWLKTIKKTNNVLARKFGQTFRYIDDLLALNDGGSFERFYKDIYPEELQLNKENVTNDCTDFLDLHIYIENGVFMTRLFDKRDHFGFDITRLPYRDSNIPSKMFYSSIAAESLRICRATSTRNDAKTSISKLVDRMMKQGADKTRISNSIKKMVNRHHINHKYGMQGKEFVKELFN